MKFWLNDKASVKHGKRMMDAVSELREHGEMIGLERDLTDALVSNALRNMGADENVAECIMKALPAVEDVSAFGNLDDEMAEYWRMHAEKATSEDMRQLLGAILAGEINRPGAVSKRTLSIVADMSRDDAAVFQKLCSVTIGDPLGVSGVFMPPHLVVATDGEGYLGDYISLNELNDMESLGLVRIDLFYNPTVGKGITFVVGGELILVRGQDENSKVMYSDVVFTKYGVELASLFTLGSHSGLKEEFKRIVVGQGLEFVEMGLQIVEGETSEIVSGNHMAEGE